MWTTTAIVMISAATAAAYAGQTVDRDFERAAAHLSAAEYHKAELAYREIVQTLSAAGHPDRRLATALNQLAAVLQYTGRYREAEQRYKESLATAERMKSEVEPTTVLNNLATLYRRTARFDEAEAIHRQILTVRERIYGPHSLQVGVTLSNLADLLRTRNQRESAEPLAKRAVEILAYYPSHHDRVHYSDALHTLGSIHALAGRDESAAELFERSRAIREELLGSGHPRVGASLLALAGLFSTSGRDAEAALLFRRAIAIFERTAGASSPELATACNNYAQLLKRAGRFAEAESHYRRALAIWEHALGPKHPDYGAGVANLADLFTIQGKLSGAAKLYGEALAVLEPHLGPGNAMLAGMRTRLQSIAITLQRSGVVVDYRQLFTRSRR